MFAVSSHSPLPFTRMPTMLQPSCPHNVMAKSSTGLAPSKDFESCLCFSGPQNVPFGIITSQQQSAWKSNGFTFFFLSFFFFFC